MFDRPSSARRRRHPVHRPALADLPLRHPVEEQRRRSPREDENLLDELHDLARRLDERMCSIERIMTADNPNWRAIACDPAEPGLADARSGARARRHQPAVEEPRPMNAPRHTKFYLDKQNAQVARASARASPTIPGSTSPSSASASSLAHPVRLAASMLIAYWIVAWLAPTKPRELVRRRIRSRRNSGRACAPRRAAPPATCARASATSTAGSPTSKPMSPARTAASRARSSSCAELQNERGKVMNVWDFMVG